MRTGGDAVPTHQWCSIEAGRGASGGRCWSAQSGSHSGSSPRARTMRKRKPGNAAARCRPSSAATAWAASARELPFHNCSTREDADSVRAGTCCSPQAVVLSAEVARLLAHGQRERRSCPRIVLLGPIERKQPPLPRSRADSPAACDVRKGGLRRDRTRRATNHGVSARCTSDTPRPRLPHQPIRERHRLTPASRPESMWAVQSGQRRTR
jgi:hypothetical protein